MIPSGSGRSRRAGLSGLFLWCALLVGSLWPAAPATAAPIALEIARVEATIEQLTNEPIVAITFTEESKRLLADFTTRNVDRSVEYRIDGRVVLKVVIREPILGGTARMMGHFTVEETRGIARRLSAGSSKVEVDVAKD